MWERAGTGVCRCDGGGELGQVGGGVPGMPPPSAAPYPGRAGATPAARHAHSDLVLAGPRGHSGPPAAAVSVSPPQPLQV